MKIRKLGEIGVTSVALVEAATRPTRRMLDPHRYGEEKWRIIAQALAIAPQQEHVEYESGCWECSDGYVLYFSGAHAPDLQIAAMCGQWSFF